MYNDFRTSIEPTIRYSVIKKIAKNNQNSSKKQSLITTKSEMKKSQSYNFSFFSIFGAHHFWQKSLFILLRIFWWITMLIWFAWDSCRIFARIKNNQIKAKNLDDYWNRQFEPIVEFSFLVNMKVSRQIILTFGSIFGLNESPNID